ncbi:hypothetical protein [Streptomyces otsuchiensis]|uniref:hypothetical protein n=1 Tax=Streptomyces otsuchiensis TaxID=2681388 RepID=UPI0027D9A2FB|nr:hypothetical protein [Streptomyces otsuchiensis]
MNSSVGGRTALQWLAAAAPEPDSCRRTWEDSPQRLTLLPAGRMWDVLTLPSALGREALDVLHRLGEVTGPVLADEEADRVGFLVPAGTSARWVGTGVSGVGSGSWIALPHPRRRTGRVRWLVAPDGSGELTDPARLELAMHEAAAVLARGAGVPRQGGRADRLGVVPGAPAPAPGGSVAPESAGDERRCGSPAPDDGRVSADAPEPSRPSGPSKPPETHGAGAVPRPEPGDGVTG